MVEVFKTNVNEPRAAGKLLGLIHQNFPHYRANFDLEDCDRILKVVNPTGEVPSAPVLRLLHETGYEAETLPDR